MLRPGDDVVICCPSGTERKFPAFHRAFHGRRARFVGDATDNEGRPIRPIATQHGAVAGLVKVDIAPPSDPRGVVIRVDRYWVAAV